MREEAARRDAQAAAERERAVRVAYLRVIACEIMCVCPMQAAEKAALAQAAAEAAQREVQQQRDTLRRERESMVR
jgi:hypothetical protein